MTKILKVRKPSDYSSWVGQTDRHPLVSVIDYGKVSPIRHSLNDYSVYGIFFHDEADISLEYGCGKYDYKEGTVICVSPGQIGGKEDNGEMVKLTMKQKDAMRRDNIELETDLNGNVIVPRYECVTSHTARCTGITNMYLSHKYTFLRMMHVSGHKTQKTFMDYIKLSSEEIADEIAAMSKKENDMW